MVWARNVDGNLQGMDLRETEAEPHFSQPLRPITSMLVASGIVAVGAYFGLTLLLGIFDSNVYLNSLILVVFVLGILSCYGQVIALMRSVGWIKAFAQDRSNLQEAPSLLAPLATLLRSRGARMQLSASSTRSILDSVASRIDEDREITRYLGNLLIFLGLLGTFYGLATTVPALVQTIRGLTPQEGDTATEIFLRLQAGLESQLGGMGTAFSSSLFGLAGSLVVGLLELFAGHGQNRFYRELEEWLSTITRVGFASGDETGSGEGNVMSGVVEHLSEQMESLQLMFTQTDIGRAQTDERLAALADAMGQLAERLDSGGETQQALMRVADGQERLLAKIHETGMDGIDAESRMRLRSIDVQLLRILEEMAAGRHEAVGELKAELLSLTRAVRQGRGRPEPDKKG